MDISDCHIIINKGLIWIYRTVKSPTEKTNTNPHRLYIRIDLVMCIMGSNTNPHRVYIMSALTRISL